jgi:hypothetical protein
MQKSKFIRPGNQILPIAIICGVLLAGCGQPSASEKTQETLPVAATTEPELLNEADRTAIVKSFAKKKIEKMYSYGDGDTKVIFVSKLISTPKLIENKWVVEVVGSEMVKSGERKEHHLTLTIKSFQTELGEGFKNFASRLQITEITPIKI